jgi:hypothetical protein
MLPMQSPLLIADMAREHVRIAAAAPAREPARARLRSLLERFSRPSAQERQPAPLTIDPRFQASVAPGDGEDIAA